ncbi:hypothetical protein [Natronomonas amylolytica]|uniref:hypothetical protein n=1 Tax=Natronomonas amylolytica TaxID=3108498 RepID=UPI00300A8ECB
MSDPDNSLLNASKLREQVRGEMEGAEELHPHAGVVSDPNRQSTLSFVESVLAESDLSERNIDATSFGDTALGEAVTSSFLTEEATEAIHREQASVVAHFTGITEQDLDGSRLRLPMRINSWLHNNDAPAFIVGAGNPNTGKTNTMSELVEIRNYALDDDLLVLSNIRSWDRTDHVVTSAHDLAVKLLEHREQPKFIVLDEASTHMDARVYRREVATQWTPLAKRFAKIGVDAAGVICHTGKDLHPEAKRLATLPYFKLEKDVVEFYERWPADADYPQDERMTIEDLEPTSYGYDPDDAAPWSWNLRADLFAEDVTWNSLLDLLRNKGPTEN